MKRPLFNLPSLGGIHAEGYWIMIVVLMFGGMFGGVMITLHYLFFVTMAVPVIGAFHREPKLTWRLFSVGTLVVATGFLLFQFVQMGSAGLIFFFASDPYGLVVLQINFVSFLVVVLIFLPLSMACAIDRICFMRNEA